MVDAAADPDMRDLVRFILIFAVAGACALVTNLLIGD